MAAIITCLRCGIEGQIGVTGLNGDVPPTRLFRPMGHNPYSGDLHYRCPACGIVLLVDPLTILDSLTAGHPLTAAANPRESKNGSRLRGGSALQRLFRSRQAPVSGDRSNSPQERPR